MRKTIIIIIAVLILVVSGIYWNISNSDKTSNDTSDDTEEFSSTEQNRMSEISDQDFINATSDPQGKILARGDINLDGYEDAQELVKTVGSYTKNIF